MADEKTETDTSPEPAVAIPEPEPAPKRRTRRAKAAPQEDDGVDPRLASIRRKLATSQYPQIRVTAYFTYTEVSRNPARRLGRTITKPIMASIYRGQMIDKVLEVAEKSGNLHLVEVV